MHMYMHVQMHMYMHVQMHVHMHKMDAFKADMRAGTTRMHANHKA